MDGTHIGLDKHLVQASESVETTKFNEVVCENHNSAEKITADITIEKVTKEPSRLDDPSQASQASQTGDPQP